MPRRATLLDFLPDFARYGRRESLVFDDGYRVRRYSYDDVDRAIHACAARLHAEGIGRGDRVLFWAESQPEWLVAFWSCLRLGAVVVPLEPRSSPDFVQRVERIVEPRLAFVGDELEAELSPGIRVWRLGHVPWEGEGSLPEVAIAPDDTVEVVFTSGTTAEPKGVVITHRNILANLVPVEEEIQKYRNYARIASPIRFLNLLPLSHLFGQALAFYIPQMLGGIVVFMRGYGPAEILGLIRRERISLLVGVPKMLDVLRAHILRAFPETHAATTAGAHGSVLRRWWRYRRVHRAFGFKFWSFLVGAAPLPPDLEEFWSRLGFLVVQGYGLTETAPIASLNHPFSAHKGSVGKTIKGVEVKIAPDGEILVRGENVSHAYYNAPDETSTAFEDGWLRTGDVGRVDEQGRLYVLGRKKDMIVTPEGLNVFPEDVEHVLNTIPGVRESAVIGLTSGSEERPHAVLVVEPRVEPAQVVDAANRQLADHQRIRSWSVWTDGALPRTEGTGKLKRRAVRERVFDDRPGTGTQTGGSVEQVIARFAGQRPVSEATALDELGLSSLERVELMVALEDRFRAPIDETAYTRARTVADLQRLVEQPSLAPEPITFPRWSRSWWARALRRVNLPLWIMPMTRVFAWISTEGREHLRSLQGPVIFASNHQSYMDTPVIYAALGRVRYRTAVAMRKEFFAAHFDPAAHTPMERFRSTLAYTLACLFFNAFPLPQREAGARQTLRYTGELLSGGYSVLIFPEGIMTATGEIGRFQPGIGMMAARLGAPVIPIRLTGVDRVLYRTWKMARIHRVKVRFGPAIHLQGDDPAMLASRVEEAVKRL
jgi:long-chain acyl-CoA synthetase